MVRRGGFSSRDYEEVWDDRIRKMVDVEDLIKEVQEGRTIDAESYLNRVLDGPQRESLFGKVLPKVLEWNELQTALGLLKEGRVGVVEGARFETPLASSVAQIRLSQLRREKAVAEGVDGRVTQRYVNLELTARMRAAQTLDDLNDVRADIEKNREVLGNRADSLLVVAEAKEEILKEKKGEELRWGERKKARRIALFRREYLRDW